MQSYFVLSTALGRELRIDLSDHRIDAQGFFRTTAHFARAGVQEYWENGKLVREYRPPNEVKASLPSLKLQVITLDHTPQPVTIENRDQTDVGTTGVPTYEDGWVRGEVVIRDRLAIYKATTTHKELSVGYHCDTLERPGIFIDIHGWQGPKGGVYPYDRVQKNIRANHLALVPRARAGSRAVLDGEGLHTDNCGCPQCRRSQEDRFMTTISIDGKDYEVDQAVADAFTKLRSDGTALSQRADSLQAELTQVNTKATMLEQQVAAAATSGDQVAIEAQARFDAYEAAKPYIDGADFDASKTACDWQTLALTTTYPEMKLDGLDVASAFAMLKQQAPPQKNYVRDFQEQVAGDRIVPLVELRSKTDSEELARIDAEQVQEKRNAWKKRSGRPA